MAVRGEGSWVRGQGEGPGARGSPGQVQEQPLDPPVALRAVSALLGHLDVLEDALEDLGQGEPSTPGDLGGDVVVAHEGGQQVQVLLPAAQPVVRQELAPRNWCFCCGSCLLFLLWRGKPNLTNLEQVMVSPSMLSESRRMNSTSKMKKSESLLMTAQPSVIAS